MLKAAPTCACAFALLVAPLGAQWQRGTDLPLLRDAVRARAVRDSAASLAGWRALAQGRVTFSLVVDHDGTPFEREVRADELQVEVYGEAPNRSKQRIVAWRDTVYFPNTLRYHRDHLGIVANDFGPIILLGEGDEVRAVLHPLSTSGLTSYEFRVRDTVVVNTPHGTTRVVAVEVRPRDPEGPGAVGTLDLDVDRATLVRFRFSFTPASYRDATVEGIAVELENALIDGTTWLPWRQSIQIRRSDPRLGTALGSLLRAAWVIDEYQLGLRLPATTFAGPAIAGPTSPGFGVWPHPFASDRAVRVAEFDATMKEFRALVGGRGLNGIPALGFLGANGLSGLIRVDRVQGVRLGGGLTWRLSAEERLIVDAGFGAANGLLSGGVAVEPSRGASGWVFSLDRRAIDLDDAPRRSGLVNSLATLVSGNDIGIWRLRERVRVGRQFAHGQLRVALDLSAERHQGLSSSFRAASGVRHSNRDVGYGEVGVMTAHASFGGWSASAEQGMGDVEWRRLTVAGTGGLPFGFEASVRGGVASSRLPLGRAFTLGGIGTLPGLADRSLWGRRFGWGELSRPIPLAIQVPGISRATLPLPLVSSLTPFVAVGGVGGSFSPAEPLSHASHATVMGIRVSLGDPIARVTIGWHPASGGVLLAIDADPLWWPLL